MVSEIKGGQRGGRGTGDRERRDDNKQRNEDKEEHRDGDKEHVTLGIIRSTLKLQ